MVNAPALWVVDDDENDQFLLGVAFQNFEPPIYTKQLYDGEELLPNLEQAVILPRLVLLDLNMVRQNGFETLAELRGMTKYRNLPIIILTNRAFNDSSSRVVKPH